MASGPLTWKNVTPNVSAPDFRGTQQAYRDASDAFNTLGDTFQERAGADAYRRMLSDPNISDIEAADLAARGGGLEAYQGYKQTGAETDQTAFNARIVAEQARNARENEAAKTRTLNAGADTAEVGVEQSNLDLREGAYDFGAKQEDRVAATKAAEAAQAAAAFDGVISTVPIDQRNAFVSQQILDGKLDPSVYSLTQDFQDNSEIRTSAAGKKTTKRELDDMIADNYNLNSSPAARRSYMDSYGPLVYSDKKWQPAYRFPNQIKNDQQMLESIMSESGISGPLGLDSYTSQFLGLTWGQGGNAFSEGFKELDEDVQNLVRMTRMYSSLFGTREEGLKALKELVKATGKRTKKDIPVITDKLADAYQNMLQAQQGSGGLSL